MITKYRQELFPGVPIVFAGINGYTPDLLNRQDRIAGVAEVQDMVGTLKLALTLHPKTQTVMVIHDYTSSGLAVRKEMSDVVDQFKDRILIHYNPDETADDLVAELKSLPPDSFVLLLTYVTDKEGRTFTREESTRLISDASPVPVYAMHETRLGYGIVGGMLLEGREHGRQAAEIALKILSTQGSAGFVVENSRSRPVFDYRQLVRFKIDQNKLPDGSILINQPVSFFQQHRALLLPGSIVAVLLITIIFILTIAVARIRHVKNEVKKSDAKYRGLFAAMVDGLILVDPETKTFVEVNPASCNMTGYSSGELTSMGVKDIHPTESLPHVFEQFDKQIRGEITVAPSLPVKRKNGSVFYADVNAVPTLVDGKKLFLGIFRDTTERKQAEAELIEYSQRLQLATDSGKLAIWDWDVKENIMFWDERMFELYGITQETFPNNVDAWINGLHPDDKKRAIEESDAALAGEKEFDTSFRVAHPDGTVKFLKANGMVIRDNDGKAVRMIGINSDITEQIQAEEEMRILATHLQQAQKMEAIGTLAGGIAHDFNNILGAILGYAEMAYEDSQTGSVKPSDLNQVVQAGHRAKDLVKQILAFSRQADSEKIPLRPTVLVKESIKLLRSSIPTTIDIQQDIDSQTDLILADPTHIHQIMMNLCTNAYHAMEEKGGTLSISLGNKALTEHDLVNHPPIKPGNFIQLSIKDTGSGITPEIKERIFDSYFTTKEAGKGTGMGLSIVHGIVKSYGGFITCHSEIGAGTVFMIYLPAVLDQIGIETKETEMTPVGTERILFIDDEEILTEMAQTMLERLGYTVSIQMSSQDTLATFKNQPEVFDLVITDQTMPGMNGVDLATKMLQIRPDIPIILCTGYSSQVSEETARAYGIKGFAMKPLAMKDIATLIRKVLDEKKSTENL